MDLTYILIGVAVVAVVFVLLAVFGSKRQAQSATPPPAQRLPHAHQSPTVPATPTPPARTPQAYTQPAQSEPVEVQQTPFPSSEDAKFDEFVVLIGHNRENAQRQIARLERNYPDKSRLWCIEKAIEDVLRDRHAR